MIVVPWDSHRAPPYTQSGPVDIKERMHVTCRPDFKYFGHSKVVKICGNQATITRARGQR